MSFAEVLRYKELYKETCRDIEQNNVLNFIPGLALIHATFSNRPQQVKNKNEVSQLITGGLYTNVVLAYFIEEIAFVPS